MNKENYEPGKGSPDVASVASHSSTDSNSIQQGMSKDLFDVLDALCGMWNQYCGDKWGHAFMSAGENALEVLDKHKLIKNETGCGGEIDWDRLEEYRQMLNRPQNAQVSDTTGDDSSNAAGQP